MRDRLPRFLRDLLPARGATVFWKVAGVLVGVQVAVTLVAVALSAWFAFDQSRALAARSLRLRLTQLAEEVERRGTRRTEDLDRLPVPLRADLRTRFPDPLVLLGPDGTPLDTLAPDASAFAEPPAPLGASPPRPLPAGLDTLLARGRLAVQAEARGAAGTWAAAPIYAPDGLLLGGVLVQPLERSLRREMAGTREAFARTFPIVGLLAVAVALVLGAVFTAQLVRPLRRITRQVERVEAGHYTVRLAGADNRRKDELGRLAQAVDRMAAAVARSVESLRQTDHMRRELIANVGHDLRTPLSALMGYLEEAERYLRAGYGGSAHEALTTATEQGDFLRRLIDDLFELSRLDRPEAKLRREMVPLGELVRHVIGMHRPAAREAGVTLVIEVWPNVPTLKADGVRLVRAVGNLVSNAIRHTARSGRVRVAAGQTNGRAFVRVKDTGEGMDAATLARVFDRYYQGAYASSDSRTRRASGGTGLGLAISRAVAEAHGGTLEATSTPGEGSTFTLTLPLEQG